MDGKHSINPESGGDSPKSIEGNPDLHNEELEMENLVPRPGPNTRKETSESVTALVQKKPLPTLDESLPKSTYPVEWESTVSWTCDDYKSWTAGKDRLLSPELQAHNTRWRFLLFPNGNGPTNQLSLFIQNEECCEARQQNHGYFESAPSVQLFVEFTLGLANATDRAINFFQHAEHCFTPGEIDWGFNSFMPLSEFHDGSKDVPAIVSSNKVTFIAHLRCYRNPDCRGLKNQGATCYMNSILQSLYFTNYFRKATFKVPTQNDEPTSSIPLALQRIFYNLQFSKHAPSTIELTKSFGWDKYESFMQHDIQEFNRVLQDTLESKMKGTEAEGAISKLFKGTMKSYVRCLNVDFESSRQEEFYDVQLTVKNCPTLMDSFKEYCAEEILEGANKYQAEQHGLQDAKKGVVFTKLPPVLHLQLRRFEYDFTRDAMVKINDRHEYPLAIDLTEFVEQEAGAEKEQFKYHLHGVLVHSGDSNGGHYYAFLQTQPNGMWAKFDDDKVTPAFHIDSVLEQNYGGEVSASGNKRPGPGVRMYKRYANAYMLVYIREKDLPWVTDAVTLRDIPKHLVDRVELERKQREQEEAELVERRKYITVTLLTDDAAKLHNGFDMCYFRDHFKFEPSSFVRDVSVLREWTLAEFLDHLADSMGSPRGSLRLWTFAARQNRTLRLDAPPIAAELPTTTMEAIISHLEKPSRPFFYVEQSSTLLPDKSGYSFHPVGTLANGSPAVIVLKAFDISTSELRYLGIHYVDNRDKSVETLLPEFRKRLGLKPDSPLLLLEEVKTDMISPLNPKNSFVTEELGTGDIVVAQYASGPVTHVAVDAVKYYKYLDSQVPVEFCLQQRHSVSEPNGTHGAVVEVADSDVNESAKMTLLHLPLQFTYEQVVQSLARAVKCDPSYIQLFDYSSTNALSAPLLSGSALSTIKHPTLEDMINYSQHQAHRTGRALFSYAILDIPAHELQNKCFFKALLLDSSLKEHGPYDIFVDKSDSMRSIVDAVFRASQRAKSSGALSASTSPLPLPVSPSARMRILLVDNHTIERVIVHLDDPVSSLKDTGLLYVEAVPEDQLDLIPERERMVQVIHFEPLRGEIKLHGTPFPFKLIASETCGQLKSRLRERLGLKERDFGKIKVLAGLSFEKFDSDHIKYLEDDDKSVEFIFKGTEFLGLEHPDKARQVRPSGFDRGIKIG